MSVDTPYDFKDGNGPVPAHQHILGGGWVADTAEVEDTVLVLWHARVFGNAKVSGPVKLYDAVRVYGNAEISGDVRLYDNVHIYGTTKLLAQNKIRIYDEVQMYEGLWTQSPPHINVPHYPLTITGPDQLYIGCNMMSFDQWLLHADDLASASPRKYTPDELANMVAAATFLIDRVRAGTLADGTVRENTP